MTHSDEPPEDHSEEPTVILDDEDIDELEELSLNAVLDEVTDALEQTQRNAKLEPTGTGDFPRGQVEARASLLADIGKQSQQGDQGDQGKPDRDEAPDAALDAEGPSS